MIYLCCDAVRDEPIAFSGKLVDTLTEFNYVTICENNIRIVFVGTINVILILGAQLLFMVICFFLHDFCLLCSLGSAV